MVKPLTGRCPECKQQALLCLSFSSERPNSITILKSVNCADRQTIVMDYHFGTNGDPCDGVGRPPQLPILFCEEWD